MCLIICLKHKCLLLIFWTILSKNNLHIDERIEDKIGQSKPYNIIGKITLTNKLLFESFILFSWVV